MSPVLVDTGLESAEEEQPNLFLLAPDAIHLPDLVRLLAWLVSAMLYSLFWSSSLLCIFSVGLLQLDSMMCHTSTTI
jgi:hypothetical protein